MVFLPAAMACEVKAGDINAADSASTDKADAIAGRFQRMMWNIRSLLT
jgi:hypothetical protein